MAERRTLDDLRTMTDAMVSNHIAAEVIGSDQGQLAQYAKEDRLPWKTLVIGNRVKHVRLSLIGFLEGRE